MKNIAGLLICLIVLMGCGKSSTNVPAFKYSFSVLLLVPGVITDQSTNQKAYEAIQTIGKDLKVNAICIENVKPEQIKTIISEAASRKIDFVIGFGDNLISPLTQAALNYPNIKFAVVERFSGNFRNFGSLSYQPSYFYLAGAVAAIKSKSGKIGSLVGDNYPSTKEEVSAFLAGAKRVNPQIEFYSVILDRDSNEALALKCTEAFKNNKVDVIYVNCNQSGQSVHKWAADNKIYTIGYLDDQYRIAPKAILTSVVIDLHKLLSYSVELAMVGKWQGRAYRFGMIDDITRLTMFRGVLNPEQEMTFEEIYKELVTQRGEFPGMVN